MGKIFVQLQGGFTYCIYKGGVGPGGYSGSPICKDLRDGRVAGLRPTVGYADVN